MKAGCSPMKALVPLILLSCSPAYPGSYRITDLLTGSSASNSRDAGWKPGQGIILEASGMEWMGCGKLAVCTRKGDVWIVDNALAKDPAKATFRLFARGLHEPLGLARDGDDILVAQRAEITRLQDRDKDGVADAYLTECSGWSVSGAYHAYVYGPEMDGLGRRWVTLNLDMGEHSNNSVGWRGWGGIIGEGHQFVPMACGMRSPSGLKANLAGDMFFTDQQGNWIPATPVYHLRKGVFYGNQEGLGCMKLPGSPMHFTPPKGNQLYPDALRSCPEFVPPAVWLPYNKMGRSATGLELIGCDGKFGPFDGQFLAGEFTNAAINRVFIEKVNGQYQGACFPFLDGFPSAVLRLKFSPDGTLFVGMSNRGWSSLGDRSYGLQRLDYTGEIPFAFKEMRAVRGGFEVEFTQPVPDGVGFSMYSFTYEYSNRYGGEEMDTRPNKLEAVHQPGRPKVYRLKVEGLRELYVYELHASVPGKGNLEAYYTLNSMAD
jgi:hypothetical protein